MQNQRLFVLFAILAVIQLCAGQSQEPITCTAGYYRSGETAKITCHYHGDIATSRNSGAYIHRHKLDARDSSSGMEVAVCHFSGSPVAVCDPEAGYRFVSFSARNLTIDVPHVSAEFQGRYTCGLVPPPGDSPRRPVHPCLLIVEEALQSGNNAQNGSGVHEALHGHVQAILAVLIIAIIAAAALIVAYKKTWFPFRKKSEAKKPDGEKGNMLDNLNSDGTKRTPQESVANPIFRTHVSASAPPAVPEKEPLLEEENDRAHNSARGDEATAKGSRAIETKPETEDERRERKNREKEEKAAEKIRLEKEKLDDLWRSLKNAQKDDQIRIRKEMKESEKHLKKLEKAEKERKTQLQKDEKLRKENPKKYEELPKKREEKERKEREKK